MKTTILIAIIFLCSSVAVSASPVKSRALVSESKLFTPSFSFLRGHKQGRNYTVTWGMSNNTGINHFIVECTYEDPYDIYSVWQQIAVIPCTNSPIFKLVDSPILPGTLNYRIIAVMNGNTTTITSGILTTVIE